MAINKISTILGLLEKPEITEEMLLDSLAQRIFLPNLETEKIIEYYITRENTIDRRFGLSSHMKSRSEVDVSPDCPRNVLGLYEKLLLNKMSKPPQNVIFLVGGVGSGKTMSILLIKEIMQDGQHNCHQDFHLCNKTRLHIAMNFNDIPYKNISNYGEAVTKFTQDLVLRLSVNLHDTLKISDTLEFLDYWNYEISKQRKEGGLEHSFAVIVDEMQQKEGVNWEKKGESAIETQKEIKLYIKENPFLFLDYQCRLWRFILEKVYKGKRSCIFTIIDNFDSASPAVQAAVRDVVISHSKRFGNTFLVCLRPETLMAKPVGIAAYVIDVEPHCGPEPFDVIIDRLKRFIDDPKSFFEIEELPEYLENHAIKLGKEIYKNFSMNYIIKEFIECIAGSNIRCALILATNLFKNPRGEYNFGPHELNRSMISPSYKHYEWEENNCVENIFHVQGFTENQYLVKGRLLKYLRTGERNTRTIGDIVILLKSFGYKRQLIYKAFMEMMKPAHQLIISNAKSEYFPEDFLQSDNDRILLTYAGIGYADNLINNLTYISMVMPDCLLETLNLYKINYGQLIPRFRLLIKFLGRLNEKDFDEIRYLRNKYGLDMYTQLFGNTMLTLDIILNVTDSLHHILLYLEKQPEYLKNIELFDQMIEIYKDIENILIISAEKNYKILNTNINYRLPRPKSPKLTAKL